MLILHQTMGDRKEDVSNIPEEYQSHSMAGVYKYETLDQETGIAVPMFVGNFVVKLPSCTFRLPLFLNKDFNPFPKLAEVTMEENDVLLLTPLKSGTHLMFEIMKMLLKGNSASTKEDYKDKWLDISSYDHIIANQTAPRVLNSHLPLSWQPPNLRRSTTKVMVCLRNFKDLFVSFYQHSEGMNRSAEKVPWSQYFRYFLYSKSVPFGSCFDFCADIWDNGRDDPNVMIVFFEDIILRKREMVEKIAKHIGATYTDQLLDEIVAATEFKSMKAAKYDAESRPRRLYGDDFTIYRKGKIGEWKNWFTVAQNEEFHKKFDEWNKERQLPMVFQ